MKIKTREECLAVVHRSLIFFLGVLLLACDNKPKSYNNVVVLKAADTVYHLIDSSGLVWRDTSVFLPLKCGLYMNNAGVIGYKGLDMSMGVIRDVYLVSIYGGGPDDTLTGGIANMNRVVDTVSFKILGDCYFADKNHVYAFHHMADGGTIAILDEADIKSFKTLGIGIYAKDKEHCYYRGHVVPGADSKTFNVFGGNFHNSAYDKHHFYGGDEMLKQQEIKEYGLDTLKKSGD